MTSTATRHLARGCQLLIAVLLVSCQPKAVLPPGSLAVRAASPEQLLEYLVQRKRQWHDLQTMARTTVSGKNGKQSFKQALLIRGENIRIDTYGLFGRTLGVFIHQNNKTLLFDPAANRFFHGQDVWNEMRNRFGMNLDFREYIPVFSGNIPRIETLRVLRSELSKDQKRYRLEMRDATGQRISRIEIDAFSWLPTQVSEFERGFWVYTAVWEDYRKIEGGEFPHRLTITLPGEQQLTVKFTNPRINKGIPENRFQLSSIPGEKPFHPLSGTQRVLPANPENPST